LRRRNLSSWAWRSERQKGKHKSIVCIGVMTSSSSYGGSLFRRKCRLGSNLIRTI
jgi:hypothetical protein